MYCDGGGGHPVNKNLEQVQKYANKGVGIACIHYGVEVPKGASGDSFLNWIGGYFEAHYSVNPHWVAKFKEFPKHPVTNGVKPFEADDEWYYHMRFQPEMKGVTPILSDLPGPETLRRGDGAHSGNPHVRASVAKGEKQHVAWVYDRPDGGRGFGFTGGHNHWNWGNENLRKVVLNALVWVAKDEVPKDGVSDKPVTMSDLEKNQDYQPPGNFNRGGIVDRFKLQAGSKPAQQRNSNKAKPVFSSKTITKATKGKAVDISVELKGAKQLYLVASDGGNGFACDWCDWAEPRLVGPAGEKKLTDLKMKTASSGFGSVGVNKNCQGQPLRIDGASVAYGFGVHANSVISFDIPSGYTHFKARGGLDNGGTDQAACGEQSSAQFFVYTEKPPTLVSTTGGAVAATRDPADAVAGLDVADGLEATLFGSEPDLLSLTNLDIDHKGRVWVCEVVNYRRHNGKRAEGDRILILEDTTGDGKADSTKVFYQGRDIDSAMGICVLGNKVIVSSSPNVWILTDTDGDDKADKKELLFSKVGQPQHDHSAHSLMFGPDGKLYWNYGNTGRSVSDKDGKPIVDKAGNTVVDNGKPYYGGMAFRCNMDGSEFEVLGHNFRNNYEVCVDSFGTLWQSDNDDDGNRGVRINYVMEFGNYGYRNEMTGAGWKSQRTNIEKEIPLRHWHLNDPGVVPNLLQTGAGSPTGITVYEGELLTKVFHNQVIHCDAGPNIVRAYPVKNSGAGYSAEIENVLHGARDNWFRPADVCVAPDGSLFVTDWYDPGVGGHNMQDLQRGRLFRVAPPGHKYSTQKFDFSTAEGAASALTNPNLATRYMAWTALEKMGAKAVPALEKLYGADNPRHRARALWALGKLSGNGAHYVELAIGDSDPNIRIVGLRLARQISDDATNVVTKLVKDKSPQVRRECAIAIRNIDSDTAAELWAELALQHDGKDRWYLEALGIAAHTKWDACLAAWLNKVGDNWSSDAGKDIIWRSRSTETAGYLAKIVKDPKTPKETHPRYMRAFDFLKGPEKEKALQSILLGL